MSVEATSKSPSSKGSSSPRVYKGKEILDFVLDLSEYALFRPLLHEDVDSECMRILGAPGGGKLTKDILDSQAILCAFHKAGLSMRLNIPVKAGSKLEVKMSTWVVPAYGGYPICETGCFGVGMIPYGKPKEEESWRRSGFKSSISHGIQFDGNLNLDSLFGGSGGGFGALMAMQMEEGKLMKYTYDVVEDGYKRSSQEGMGAQMTLAPVVVQITRDTTEEGNCTFGFSHGSKHASIRRKDDGEDMQLYLNCLSWRDNNTYVRFDEITIDPARQR